MIAKDYTGEMRELERIFDEWGDNDDSFDNLIDEIENSDKISPKLKFDTVLWLATQM